MSLDLTKVAAQVEGMVGKLKAGASERQKRLDNAVNILHSQSRNWEQLKKKILSSKTTWLVAGLVEGLDKHYKATPLPDEFTVIAADGSHIEVDRHRSVRCFLINIGSVQLRYGPRADAILDASPRLYAEDNELVIASPENKGRDQLIEGGLLGIKRGVEECRQLAALSTGLPPGSSALALLDGSLILWGLEAYPDFVTEALLDNGFLNYLNAMKEAGKDKNMSLVSYISSPRSTDVVNALRVAICPYEPADCDRNCSAKEKRDCESVAGVQDRELFASVLGEGERSTLFISPSSIVREHYGEHRVYFFYLKMEEEIAR
ncbi:MAG: DNA double-strand break repair nuclease NurA, partial [Chloroflexota bacterium]